MQRALLLEYTSNDVSALTSQIWNSPKETSHLRDSTGFAMSLHLHKLDRNSYLLKIVEFFSNFKGIYLNKSTKSCPHKKKFTI
jgi:hypothetical protein